jgi:hypothetical protein
MISDVLFDARTTIHDWYLADDKYRDKDGKVLPHIQECLDKMEEVQQRLDTPPPPLCRSPEQEILYRRSRELVNSLASLWTSTTDIGEKVEELIQKADEIRSSFWESERESREQEVK